MRPTDSQTRTESAQVFELSPYGLAHVGSCQDERLGYVDLFVSQKNPLEMFAARKSIWICKHTELAEQFTREMCLMQPELFTKVDRIVQTVENSNKYVKLVFRISASNLHQALCKDPNLGEQGLAELVKFLASCLENLQQLNIYHPDISTHSVYVHTTKPPSFRLLSPYLYAEFQNMYCSEPEERLARCVEGLVRNSRQVGLLLSAVLGSISSSKYQELSRYAHRLCTSELQSAQTVIQELNQFAETKLSSPVERSNLQQQNFERSTKEVTEPNLTKSQKCLRLLGKAPNSFSPAKPQANSHQASIAPPSNTLGQLQTPNFGLFLKQDSTESSLPSNLTPSPNNQPATASLAPETKAPSTPSGGRKEPVRVFGSRLQLNTAQTTIVENYKLSPEVQSIVDKYSQGSPKNSVGSVSDLQTTQTRIMRQDCANAKNLGIGFPESVVRAESDVLSNSGCSSTKQYTSKYLERHRNSGSVIGDSGISSSSVIAGSEIVRGLVSPKGPRSQMIMTSSTYVLGDSPAKEEPLESIPPQSMYASNAVLRPDFGRTKLFTESTGQQDYSVPSKQKTEPMRDSQESSTKEPEIRWGKSYLDNTSNRYRFVPNSSVRNLASKTTDGSVIVPSYYSSFLKSQHAAKSNALEAKKVADTEMVNPQFNLSTGQDNVSLLAARTNRRTAGIGTPSMTYNLFEVAGSGAAGVHQSLPKMHVLSQSNQQGISPAKNQTESSMGHKSRSVSFNLGAIHNTSVEMTPNQPKGILKNKKAVQTVSKAAELERKYSTPFFNH